jgi:hypothetical protein
MYYRMRYYDTERGRFIGRDPISYLGGYNLYQLMNSSPVSAVDPYGLFMDAFVYKHDKLSYRRYNRTCKSCFPAKWSVQTGTLKVKGDYQSVEFGFDRYEAVHPKKARAHFKTCRERCAALAGQNSGVIDAHNEYQDGGDKCRKYPMLIDLYPCHDVYGYYFTLGAGEDQVGRTFPELVGHMMDLIETGGNWFKVAALVVKKTTGGEAGFISGVANEKARPVTRWCYCWDYRNGDDPKTRKAEKMKAITGPPVWTWALPAARPDKDNYEWQKMNAWGWINLAVDIYGAATGGDK